MQVIFSKRKDAIIHLSVFFNASEVAVKSDHKILSMLLDSKLNFQSHIKQAVIKATRGTGIIPYLSKYVSWGVLDQIYKLYVRPHLYYDDIIYHKYDPEFKLDFPKKLESIQYSAALAVTRAWSGTDTDRLCEEVGWEILHHRKWYRCLCHFYKLRNYQRPYNLYSEIPQERIVLNRVAEVLKQVKGEHLTLFDFMEKQTLEKRCFFFKTQVSSQLSDHDKIIKNSEY